MQFANVHERWLPVDAAEAGRLLDGLASDGDRLWPRRTWPQMRFDGPLAEGAVGGHGPIRYSIEAYEPGRRLCFRFEPQTGFEGRHWFEVTPHDGGVWLRHVLHGHAGWKGALQWSLAIRHLHDALVEDALDNAERVLTGSVKAPARWSPWVKLLRAMH